MDESVDDDTWKAALSEAIPGESAQQIQQRKANNQKIIAAHEKKMKDKGKNQEEELRCHHHHNWSWPGRVPNGVGVATMGQFPEHNNAFYGMLSRHFYYSHQYNRVYAG